MVDQQPKDTDGIQKRNTASRYDHILRLLLLGDHNVGKTAVLQAFRRQNLGNFRGRRHSQPLRPYVTVDIEMSRGKRNIMIKAVDSGERLIYPMFESIQHYVFLYKCLDIPGTCLDSNSYSVEMVLLRKGNGTMKFVRGSVVHPTELKEKHYFNHRNETYKKQEAIQEAQADYYLKVVLLGDVGVGKTRLANDYSSIYKKPKSERRIIEREKRTVECVNRVLNVRNLSVLLRLYDTAGQEKFRSLTASYYRGAHGCLVLFDVTKETTFNNVPYWIHDLREYSTQPDICTILVGTKSHVPQEEREVTYERAQKYAESVELPYMEVSSEEGISVTEVFEKLADVIIETLTKDKENSSDVAQHPNKVILGIEAQKQKKTFSCSC
ncbi:uncharacterized protein LOC128230785 [Mya arenaria]|uniref:uncharacterized protein LOC128230785 n=1 Tax=Mya arenaria TaxID=6604 RepID=UPI0022E2C83A|nr:uncharacterized protein LOC128230785 [Mya arenaria]